MVNENLYFENLFISQEKERLRKEKMNIEFMKTMQYKVKVAYTNFKVWCRCHGKNPYEDTYKNLRDYIYGGDNRFKNNDRFLFTNKNKKYVEYKKELMKLIESDK